MAGKTPIAIIGMGCQFPQAPDLASYWRNIREARVCFSDVPAERWNHALYYHPSPREIDKSYARRCGFIEDVRSFAALHYGLSPLRVRVMDPQHRLLIESVRHTLSDAGYETKPLKRDATGIFIGASVSEHKDIVSSRLRASQMFDGAWGRVPELPAEVKAAIVEDVAPVRAFSIAGNLLNMMAATVAQVFDLGGPAFSVDAACSSALVATHEAILHLRAGECDTALAGGVYLNLTPDNLVGFSRIGAISRTDHCRPFDASADGFVLGEGVGLVMLKRLDDALRDGDRIYAVVRGSGINNDGRSEGPMTPRQGGQLAALNRAYAECGVTPDTVGFIEAHGTATGVGDVVEVAALKECYAARRQGPIDAVLSSVKANVGHTMSAAGAAGLIKAAMVLREKVIPPQAAFENQHPSLDLRFGDGGFRIAQKEEHWEASAGHPRRAAVSSFGFGGTNCHLVLEEAPERARSAAPRAKALPHPNPPSLREAQAVPLAGEGIPQPFAISSPTPALLKRHLAELRLALDLGEGARATLEDLAFTFAGRRHEKACVAFVADSRQDLAAKLEQALVLINNSEPASRDGISFVPAPLADSDRGIAFLLPGQGAQAVGLAESVYRRFPTFRAKLDALAGPELLAALYPPAPYDEREANATLMRTEICQPVMAALGIALADLIRMLGVEPSLAMGHSLGEFAALAVGGALDADATVRFVAERGRLMAELTGDHGAMAAVAADRATVERYVAGQPGVAVANFNHPKQVVISGTTEGVQALCQKLDADGIAVTVLPVSHAFHSPIVAPVSTELSATIEKLAWTPPQVPVISCIAPGPYPAEANAARQILMRHAASSVDFTEGVRRAAQLGARVFVQVGAGSALISMARATLAAEGVTPAVLVTLAATDAAADDGARKLCQTLAELSALGLPVRLNALQSADARTVSLPVTPLETEQYWIAQREPRPPLAPLVEVEESSMKSNGSSNEGLVALFREQMAVLQQQNDIIRHQTETLARGGTPLPTTAPAIAARPAAPAVSITPAAAAPVAFSAPQPVAALPAPAFEAATHGIAKGVIETQVLDVVSRVSAFPRTSVKAAQRLIGDLGFDSIMAVELSSKLAEAFPGLGGIPKSLFVDSTTVREVVAYVESKQSPSAAPAAKAARSSTTAQRYVPTWVARGIAARPAFAEAPFVGPTLIVADAFGVAPLLARLLTDAGRPATVGGPDSLRAAAAPRTIIDLRALAPTGDILAASSMRLREHVEGAFHLAQTASRESTPAGFVVAFVGDEAAGLAGFAKALAREWSQSLVKSIELDAAATPEAMAQALAAELLGGDATVEVRYRGGQRQIVELAPAPIHASVSPLREGAVVAISGGARGLGTKLGLELAKKHHAKLILLGRSPADATTAALIADIGKAGGQAVYLPCDIRDEAAVQAALTEGRRKFGPIETVIHAAGLIADAPIAKKSDDDFAKVFDTKAGGALALWRATTSDPLKHFVIYGSWAGRFGSASQTDYAAANHLASRLTERFAATRATVHSTTLDLPPWEESAMVRTLSEAVRGMMRVDGVTFLSDVEGLALVMAELGGGAPSGEVLFGRDVPASEMSDATSIKVTLATHPYLGDHRIEGKPVLPLAGAMDYAAAAARRVLPAVPPGSALTLRDFELIEGIALLGEAVWVHARAVRQGADAVVELRTSETADGPRKLAYRCRASIVAGTLDLLPAPTTREIPSLPLSQFYDHHTFHGPRMRGVVAIDDIGPTHIAGSARASRILELVMGAGEFAIDPLLIDSSFQLAAYWGFTCHGRAGLPLGFTEYRALAPIEPGAEISCFLSLENTQGDLFVGHIDYRDRQGRLVAQLRGMKAQLRAVAGPTIDPATYRVEEFPEYLELRQRIDMAKEMGIENPYFRVHERVTNDTSVMNGREMINFSSYNYVGLSGDADVSAAVTDAVLRFGTSVSASRVASGEKPIHRELEAELASFLGCEDSVVMVGGHATNVGVIAQLCGPGDLILHDALAHDSIMAGAKLSGAARRSFPHNDWEALDATLTLLRPTVKRVLIAVEGTYSMDGDIPPLPKFIELKKRHGAILLVDEAHSLGVLGKTGRGIGEHFDVVRKDVDLWMGTLSKSLASCGGYIAGSHAMVEYLKYNVGAFVFSVGISPPNSASALAALRKLDAHPEMVTTLHERAHFFLELCRERGINTGMSEGSAVIPCIVGNSFDCLLLAQALGKRGINVQPILYPAVEEHLARLRFFITSRHSHDQLRTTADALAEELGKLNPDYLTHKPSPGKHAAIHVNGTTAAPTI